MADNTGMGQAQNTDKQAAQAGRARRATKWVGERIPGTPWKKQRMAREAEEKIALEERVRHQTRKELESVAQAPDTTTTKGEFTPVFNRQVLDAVRRGQSRTASNTPDMLIRAAFTDPAFINAIRTKAVPTPIEEADTVYAKEMVKRRQRLSSWLDMARQHSDYTLPRLTAHEMDIIYSTAMGRPAIWEGKDDKGRPRWPESKLTPPEAVLKYLESVAMRERPGGEGMFIGNVLKDLAGSPSALSNYKEYKGSSDRCLFDSAYINKYLYRISAGPIDSAVDSFRKLVREVLSLPTGELHPELGVPGIGYQDAYYEQRLAMMNSELAEARALHRDAAAEAVAAQGSYEQVMETKAQVQDRWDKLPKETRDKITAAETQTKAMLEQAKEKEGNLTGVIARTEAAIRKFRKESSTESATEAKVQDFWSMLVHGVEFRRIEESMEPMIRNPEVARVLERAQELFLEKRESPELTTPEVAVILENVNRVLEERERLRPLVEKLAPKDLKDVLGRELGQLEADIGAIRDAVGKAQVGEEMRFSLDEVAGSVGNFAIPREFIESKLSLIYLDDKSERADQLLGDSSLPQETKVEMAKTFAALRRGGFAEEQVTTEIAGLMKGSAFPLGRAAAITVKKLNRSDYENIVGITDAQKIIARMEWEATSNDIDSPSEGKEGRWIKFKQWAGWNFTTWQGFFARRFVVWAYEKFLDGDIQDIRPKNAFQRVTGKRPDGKVYTTRVPRIVPGMLSLAFKAYLVGAVGVYMGNNASFSEHFIRWPLRPPISVSIDRNADGSHSVHSHWQNPLPWLSTPQRPPSEIIRVIHDSYDIPERLTGRPASYLRSEYGLGHRLPTEQGDGNANGRIDWVKAHPDVIRFFQERRSMREVISWDEMPHNMRNPDMCSTSARRIPPVCSDSQYGLNLADAQAIQDYRPLDERPDGWRAEVPEMRVCCFVKLTTRPVADGLMLNRSQSDRFVDALQAAERGGTRIDSAYMRNPVNRARWVQEWYLITPTENEIMETFKIRDRDNVQFILTQGTKVSNVLLPRCGDRGEATELIEEAHRDEFVRLWREEIGRIYQGHNPTVEDVPEETLTAAFSAARTAAVNSHWVEDTTHDHERREVRRELQLLNLQTDTAVDAVLAQQDLHDFVKLFANASSAYRINPERSDEFIQVLVQHKMRGGSLNDFNPYAESQGSRVQWAIGMGYIAQAQTFHGTQDRGPATGGSASAAQPAAPAPIPDLSPEATQFYSSQANEAFNQFVTAVINGLHSAHGMDGRIMSDALAGRFGGNQERMDRAMKAEVFRILSSTGQRDAALRGGFGISVSGTGGAMTASLENPIRARSSLRTHLVQFVHEQQAIAVPPAR